jgi:hypothetical protein
VYVSNWSLVHLVSGLFIGWLLMIKYPTEHPYWVGFQIHTIWEVWQLLVQNTPWTLRGFIDVGMDTFLFMLGMAVFSRLLTGKRHEYST